MLKLKSLNIKNFKSFPKVNKTIKGFSNLNVFIGKNNQGKSNLIKAIEFLDYNRLTLFLDEIPDSTSKLGERGSVVYTREIESLFHRANSNQSPNNKPIEFNYILKINKKTHTYNIKIERIIKKDNGVFLYRDMKGRVKETNNPISTFFDGKNIILNDFLLNQGEIVHSINPTVNKHNYEEIKELLLKLSNDDKEDEIQKLMLDISHISPDFHKLSTPLFGRYIMPKEISGRHYKKVGDEIIEKKLYDNVILQLENLSLTDDSLGSGQLQTITLFFEIFLAKNINASIITIDELELRLYPALLKRVLHEIEKYSNKLQFFISTHSNIMVSTPLKQKIYFIQKKGNSSQITPKKLSKEIYEIFDDLGVKASDILQSNGVIWVEGPSDIAILKEWLKKLGSSQKDFDQISFAFYGGALINHIKFSKLLKLNRNCIVIQDSDKKSRGSKLNENKLEVYQKCKSLDIHCWTTKKREIENYFSEKAIKIYSKKHKKQKVDLSKPFGDYSDIKDIIITYERDKTEKGRKIASYMVKEEIVNINELAKELIIIKNNIEKWNEI